MAWYLVMLKDIFTFMLLLNYIKNAVYCPVEHWYHQNRKRGRQLLLEHLH